MRTQYLADVSNADRWLGELLPLVRARVTGDTLILFISTTVRRAAHRGTRCADGLGR